MGKGRRIRPRSKLAAVAGGLMSTVGTKLKKEELAELSPLKRVHVFGAGVIVSKPSPGGDAIHAS